MPRQKIGCDGVQLTGQKIGCDGVQILLLWCFSDVYCQLAGTYGMTSIFFMEENFFLRLSQSIDEEQQF